ncbi:uncharacterized protein [Parasteatoda tepidariorum]|uniref:uncharacterized protein n=1 Tax=Parasteatoda tepidariorum TaxID=114398 RepID=UPI000A2C0A79|nr:uncharacterized protein LOC107444383 [Parasteatoda tepidariorum]
MDLSFKSKRNSRYKYGRRRSRSLGGIISTELCKTIDNCLPPEERLKLLIENALKTTCLIVGREFGIPVTSEEVNENISKCLTNIDSELKEKDLYKTAVFGEESLKEEPLINNLAMYNKEAARMDKESMEWDELLTNERKALNDVKNQTPAYSFKKTLDCQELEKVDFRKHTDDLSLIVESHNFQVDKISSSCEKLNKYIELTNKVVACLSKETRDNFSRRIEHTPRKLIKMFKKSYK